MKIKKSAFFDFLYRYTDYDFETFMAGSTEDVDYINWHDFCLISAYGDESSEYEAVRSSCALFDASPIKKYRFTGTDTGPFFDTIMTRRISTLKPMHVGYATFCNDNGMLRDDGLLYKFTDDDYLLMISELDHDDYFAEVARHFADVSIEEVTPSLAGLAVQGPKSCAVLSSFGFTSLETLKPFEIKEYAFKDSSVIVARAGFTADLGYELWCAPELIQAVEETIKEAEQSLDMQIGGYGLKAMNALRLEGGFVVPGWETAQTFEDDERERTPAELGISWTVDLNRENDFIGKTALLKEKEDGPRFKTLGLTIEQKCDPEEAIVYSVVDGKRQKVGKLTSVAWSYRLNCHVALASVRTLVQGSSYHLEIGGQQILCRETSIPFVNFDRYRQTPAPCE